MTRDANSALSDEALLLMLRSGHTSALHEIFNRYHGRLYKTVMGVLMDGELAKDIVQEIFIDLWNRRESADIQLLQPYLISAVRLKALSGLRKGKVKAQHLAMMERIQFVNQTEDAINVQELNHSLRLVLSQLSPRCKEVFELSRFENLTHKQIAGRLGITPKTVEVQIHKALTLLRKKLDKAIIISIIALFG
ncbi:RNA polymerase sigma-70 factor [Chryseolinea sp. T2]|uniref:RNA polymerase sigma-70 factor n=1 Tax=Chryseolinea sp. T2 TaxID=3129255 RepID=UPI003077409A